MPMIIPEIAPSSSPDNAPQAALVSRHRIMHLPPLDVAVYPVVTMGHGRHVGPRLSTALTSSLSLATSTPSPDFATIQKVIRNVFRSPKITVLSVERLQGRLHQIYRARLADGTSLVLKCPPACTTRLLRNERHGLETERKALETLREYTQLPVPQVIKYASGGGVLGSAFLMTSHIPGRPLSELSAYLSTAEKDDIDRTLGIYVRSLTALSATQFGLTHQVFARKGHTAWRDAFLALLEAVLRDAEDMLVTISYDSIRYYVRRHSHVLDEVVEPRLVALDVCKPENVLIDEQSKQVTGIVGFSNVVWGDPLLSGGIANGTEAFFEGYGECPARIGGTRTRSLMYAVYTATVQIVANHYRSQLEVDEVEARRSLTYALNELAQM